MPGSITFFHQLQPLTRMEAAASRIPSVATDVGGVPEVVVDGETGWLVDSLAPQRFAAALRTAFGDPAERRRRGAAARARAERIFGAAAWAERLAECYSVVAGGRTVGQASSAPGADPGSTVPVPAAASHVNGDGKVVR